jgi:hypothetical protein
MARSRLSQPLQIPSFVGDFLRELPDEAGAAVDTFGASVPPVDLAEALGGCSEQELLTLISLAPPSIGSSLSRIGVQVRGTRPRQMPVMKLKLAQGLRTRQQDAVRLAMTLIEPTYRLLVVRSAHIEDQVPADRIEPAVDTPALRALALAASLYLPDPSAPLVLAWMLRTDNPSLSLLIAAEQIAVLREGAGQLEDTWEPQWQPALERWARHRAVLDCPGHGCELDPAINPRIAVPLPQRTDAGTSTVAEVAAAPTVPPQKRSSSAAALGGVRDRHTVAPAPAPAATHVGAADLAHAPDVGAAASGRAAPKSTASVDQLARSVVDELPATLAAAERISNDLTLGKAPHEQDLAAVMSWTQKMRAVTDNLGLSVDASTHDIAAHQAAQDLTSAVRGELESLLALRGPDKLGEQVFELHAQVDALLASWTPELADSHDVQSLLALRTLALAGSAGTDEDDDELLEQAHKIKQELPETLNKLAAAAARGRLRFAAAGTPSGSTAPASRAQGTAVNATEPSPAPSAAAAPVPVHESRPMPTAAPAEPTEPTEPAAPGARSQGGRVDPTQPVVEPGAATTTPAPKASEDANAHEATGREVPEPSRTSQRSATERSASSAPPAAATPPRPSAPALRAPAHQAGEAPETAAPPVLPLPTPHDGALALQVTGAVDRLLAEGRLGLAHQILETAGAIGHADTLEVAALAEAMQGPHGPCSMHLTEILRAIDEDDLRADPSCSLLSAAALSTMVLFTAESRAAHLLQTTTPELDPTWTRLARLVCDAAHSGALDHDEAAAGSHNDLSHAAAHTAAARAGTDYPLRNPQATTLLRELREPHSTVGAALHAAATNDVSQAAHVIETLAVMTGDRLTELVLTGDRARGATGGHNLPERDREDIVAALTADRTAALRWAEAASQHSAADWSSERLSELRTALTEHAADLLAALPSYSKNAPLAHGAAAFATRAVSKMTSIVTGDRSTSQVERGPRSVLRLELLKVDGAQYDPSSGDVSLPEVDSSDRQLDALLNVLDEADFTPALNRRLATDDFTAAIRLAEAISPEQVARIARAREMRAAALLDELKRQRLMLVRARSGVAGAQTQDMLEARIVQAERLLSGALPDVASAAKELDEVSEQMTSLREQAVDDLRAKIEAVHAKGTLEDAERDRLLSCLAREAFDQVEYELQYLEAEESVPATGDDEIGEFFPAIVNGYAGGLTAARIDALAEGQDVAGVSLPGSPEARAEIADALRRWTQLPARLRAADNHDVIRDLLGPVLRAIGFDLSANSLQPLAGDDHRGRGRRMVQLQARPTGAAVIPAFGSLAERRYRVLMVWDQQNVEELTRLRELDTTLGDPLIICYFGTISEHDRLALAKEWNEPTKRPTIVMDDAALVYTAAAGREKFARLMRITMPFSATAPFSREKTPKVPLEMFYGRRAAMSEIARMDGPSLLFGGRGMGKSALLSVMQREARDNASMNLKVVWIELERSPEFDEPALIWVKLAEALAAEDIQATNTRRVNSMNSERRVHTIVEEWLAANPGSRLLLLIDEADAFFGADARREFRQTSKLFSMANKVSRCKVVFAGLHGVAHHHGVGNNPFSPSGALPIGPLERGDAYRLFAEPLRALGYSIANDDANHVLMVCNNQPFLIQLVATRLTERLLKTRATAAPKLPWPVPRAIIDAVLSDSQVKEQIHRAFKITLDLDPRFSVIVNLLGLYAYKQRDAGPLAEADLLEQCRQAWPTGFKDIPFAHFRELLNELEELGMLGAAEPVRGGRSLRGTAVLESLGNPERIELALAETRATALTEADARMHFRPSIGDFDGRPGPLNTAQLADLAGRQGNRVRILVGTPLTGLDNVIDALANPLHQPVLRNVQVTRHKGEFRGLLKNGLPEDKRLTVVSPLHELVEGAASCQEALMTAQELRPSEPGHARAVVLTTGPGNADWLHQISTRSDIDKLVVPLERLSVSGLKLHWRDATAKLAPLGDELVERTMELTGGWPMLVDDLVTRARKVGAAAALNELEVEQGEPRWAAQLLVDAGVLSDTNDVDGVADGMLMRVVRLLVDGGACDLADLAEFAAAQAIDQASLTVAGWFSLLVVDDDGQATLAPLIGAAWKSWTHSLTPA